MNGCNIIHWPRALSVAYLGFTRSVATSKIPAKLLDYNHNFSSEEQDLILSAFNGWDVADFTRRKISKLRSEAVVKYRKKYGEFTSLEHILEVEGFGLQTLERMCLAIARNCFKSSNPPVETQRAKTSFIEPEFNLPTFNSIASVSHTPEHIACNILSRDGEVVHWLCHDVHTSSKKPPKFMKLYSEIEKVYQSVQDINVDLLLLEEAPSYHGKLTIYHMLQAQMEAALIALFSRNKLTSMHTIKQHHVSKLFGTQVLRERVSSYQIVDAILDNSPYTSFKNVHIKPSLKDSYYHETAIRREVMDRALLLNIAFFELVILKRETSIRAALGKEFATKIE